MSSSGEGEAGGRARKLHGRALPALSSFHSFVAEVPRCESEETGLASGFAKLGRIVRAGVALLFTSRTAELPPPPPAAKADRPIRFDHHRQGHGASSRPPHPHAEHLRGAAGVFGAAASLMHVDDAAAAPAPALSNRVIVGPPLLKQLCFDAARGNAVVTFLLQSVQDVLFSPSDQSRWTVVASAYSPDLFLARCALLAGVAARLLFEGGNSGGGEKMGWGGGRAEPRLRVRRGGGGLGAMARVLGLGGMWPPGQRDAAGHQSDDVFSGHAMADDEDDLPFGGDDVFGLGGDGFSDALTQSLEQEAVPVRMDDFMRRVYARYAAAAPIVAAQSVVLADIATPLALASEVVAAFEAAGLSFAALPLRAFADSCVTFGVLAATTMMPTGVALPQKAAAAASSDSLDAVRGGFARCYDQFVSVLRVLQGALRTSKREINAPTIADFARKLFADSRAICLLRPLHLLPAATPLLCRRSGRRRCKAPS